MSEIFQYFEWMKNLMVQAENLTSDTFFIDISIVHYFNPHCDMNDRDEKQHQEQAELINEMGNQEEIN